MCRGCGTVRYICKCGKINYASRRSTDPKCVQCKKSLINKVDNDEKK